MGKLLVCALFALLAVTLVVADRKVDQKKTDLKKPEQKSCKGHGYDCISAADCCEGMRCNSYAGRCQVIITPEELKKQREKIFNKRKNNQNKENNQKY